MQRFSALGKEDFSGGWSAGERRGVAECKRGRRVRLCDVGETEEVRVLENNTRYCCNGGRVPDEARRAEIDRNGCWACMLVDDHAERARCHDAQNERSEDR